MEGSKISGRLRERLTYANVMATIAVFLALGGTAVAIDGSLPGQNTVGSADIINGEVTNGDLAVDSVGSNKIADRSVKNADLSVGASSSNTIADGGIQGVDVKDNSLTGTQIDEPSLFNDNSLDAGDVSNNSTLSGPEINEAGLAPVPTAQNAFRVGNNVVQQLDFAADNDGGASGGGSLGPLGLSFRCNLSTPPAQEDGDLDVFLSTPTDNSSLAVSDHDSYADIEDFDIADNPVDLEKLLGTDSDEIINLVYVEGSGFGFNRVVTAQLHILDDAPAGTASECMIAGHVISRAAP